MDTQVSKILDLLTKGMEGVPDIASQAFQIMVRGEFVNGVAEIVLSVVMFAIAIIVSIVIWKKLKEDPYSASGFWLILVIPLIVFGLFSLYDGITSVMAPEYDAVMALLKMVK
jgi:hypothetical protein|nr:MAG TPA: hypothetical protein [Caudoviricetes sp.]